MIFRVNSVSERNLFTQPRRWDRLGWQPTPKYLMIRDRDSVYGVRAMGIRDRPIASRSPWQNGHAERLIGSLRQECLDHIVVFGERHLRHVLFLYMDYYNTARTITTQHGHTYP